MRTTFIIGAIILFCAAGAANAQEGKMFGSAQVGINLPLSGDLSNWSSIGFGLGATFIMQRTDDMEFTGELGYFSYPSKSNSSGASSSVSDIPLLVGVRYFVAHGDLPMYVAGELGLHFQSWSSTVTVPVVNGFGGTYSASASQTNFGLGGQFGILKSLSATLDLDASARLHIITGSGGGLLFGINGGVLFHIN